MQNKLDEIPFSEFLRVMSEYVQLAKETNNDLIALAIFEQEHPDMFSMEAKDFIHDFLNSAGLTDELLDKLRSKSEVEQDESLLGCDILCLDNNNPRDLMGC